MRVFERSIAAALLLALPTVGVAQSLSDALPPPPEDYTLELLVRDNQVGGFYMGDDGSFTVDIDPDGPLIQQWTLLRSISQTTEVGDMVFISPEEGEFVTVIENKLQVSISGSAPLDVKMEAAAALDLEVLLRAE